MEKKSFPKLSNTTWGIIIFVFLLVIIFVTIYFLQQEQVLQQSAHTPQPSVTATCSSTGIVLTSNYTIVNVPSRVICNVKATDSQGFLNDSFSFKNGDPIHTKSVTLHQTALDPGIVTFIATCSDKVTRTNQVGYKLSAACGATPSAVPTPTPVQACMSNIVFDGKNATSGVNVTQITWKHTTVSQSNTILLVGLSVDSGPKSPNLNPVPAKSVTYNGIALKKLLEKDCDIHKCSGEVWYLMSPPAGQHLVVVTLTANASINAGSATFSNVDALNPFATPIANVASGGNPTVTIPNTRSSQTIFDIASLDDSYNSVSTLISNSGSTNLWSLKTTDKLTLGGAQFTHATNGSTTLGWKASAASKEEYSDIAIPLNPVAALPASCITPTPTPTIAVNTPTPPETTDTPTPTLVPIITLVPTPTATPTPTLIVIVPTSTPTPTQAPTPTPTYVPGITATPTPTNIPGTTPTPTPTNAPTIVIVNNTVTNNTVVNNPKVTPKQTLMASGPSDFAFATGTLGSLLAVAGVLLFLL